MLVNRTYVKFICALLFMLFINGCAIPQASSDREALVNAGRGAVNVIITNYRVYRYALQEKNSDVTKSLVYATLTNANILKAFEEEAGNGYVIEESLNTRKLNEICWMAKFARETKDIISPKEQDHYKDIYAWLNNKEQAWVKKINSSYTKDELGPDDCRK
ncbi:hypothetical protein [Acinetobacter baumannii]|uniref:hypothetical protein n=1 Tax=Acinetobacter baumannii TaxID=470 RepID=UPI00094D4783|nr:hypothetical protein [Acinetobacter baumannii]PNH13792.1 hypothetical protein DSM30011_014580 [Acinetobacter baumannii]UMO42022.1 hypothetical protein L2Z44_12460 [Acinetobacter baumannii]HCA4900513.1 hypothetical protein [Acinetobacter baumannii]